MADTVVIFDPQGIARDVPYEHMKDALANGGRPGVLMTAPDGSTRAVPADKMQEAAKNGGQVLPLQEQQIQHPGFWATLGSDLKGMLSLPSGVSPYPGMDVEAKQAALAQGQQQDQSRKAAGYSAPYRALAPIAQGVGVNVPGMEQSAAEGDEAGVMGHAAAVPTAIAAGEVAGRVVPKVAPPVIRGTVRAANTVLDKAAPYVGGAVGAGLGYEVGGHFGAEVGGAIGAGVGKVVQGTKIPGENFGIKSPTMAEGPVEYMGASDALKLKRTDPQAFALRQQQIAKYGMQDRPRGGMQMTGQVREIDPTYRPPAEPAPAPNERVAPNVTVLRTKSTPQAPVDPVKALQQAQALRGPTNDVVAAALPDASKFVQAKTQAEVNLHLRNGDVEAAQAALDKATGKTPADRAKALRDSLNELDGESGDFVKPQPTIHNGSLYEYKGGQFYKDGKVLDSGADIADAVNALEARRKGLDIEGQGTLRPEQPKQLQGQVAPKSDFPPPAPTNPGTTNDIRANLPENRAKRLTESRDDAGVSQEMNWDLQRHRFMAESEARKEFIARNSTGTTKGDLVRQAGGNVPEQPVKYTKNKLPKSPSASEDLTDILQQSLDAAKKRKQAGQ